MNPRMVVIGLVCVAGAFVFLSGGNAVGTDTAGGSALPASLDQYYPPNSPAPVYLIGMVGLARPFSGMVSDVLEGDLENARSNFEAFRTAYLENSTMVPEWKDRYPTGPLDRLSTALASGNPGEIMPAVDAAGAVCHGCHLSMMAPVQQKYRWGDFAGIALTDPLSKQDVSFARLMLMMETNFDGIGNALGQGQLANARREFEGFKARFAEMANGCIACHDSERRYYVSQDITTLIADLGTELAKSQPNPGGVTGLLQAIGQESCSKCHLVHIPAAYSQQRGSSH